MGLTMVSSAFLMWHEFRANPVEEDDEWTARAWIYATAFGLSFFLSCYFLPVLYFS